MFCAIHDASVQGRMVRDDALNGSSTQSTAASEEAVPKILAFGLRSNCPFVGSAKKEKVTTEKQIAL